MVKILCLDGDGSKDIAVADAIFNRAFNEPLIHQLVNSYLANARVGSRAQKGRSDVSGSTHKQWKQKGTGRARTGSAANPLWRGGGKIFPNKPNENFSHKINRKMYRAGMCSILSQLVRDERLKISNEFVITQPKSKELARKLRDFNMSDVVIITDGFDNNLFLASRNMPSVRVLDFMHIDPISLLRYDNVIFTREAIVKIEGLLL
ncbi:MAG: 50S ribosomal protein L4 [Nitrosomonas sp.]|nr:50S ribosomal protein L4 [Nitrosomonas sp.]